MGWGGDRGGCWRCPGKTMRVQSCWWRDGVVRALGPPHQAHQLQSPPQNHRLPRSQQRDLKGPRGSRARNPQCRLAAGGRHGRARPAAFGAGTGAAAAGVGAGGRAELRWDGTCRWRGSSRLACPGVCRPLHGGQLHWRGRRLRRSRVLSFWQTIEELNTDLPAQPKEAGGVGGRGM